MTFARVMLTPIPPSELFAMLTTGAPAELTLGLAVQSINGLHNWTADPQGEPNFDPEFAEVLELLGALRRDGVLGFRFDTQAGPRTAYLLLEDQEASRSSHAPGACLTSCTSIPASAASRSASASAVTSPPRSGSTRAH